MSGVYVILAAAQIENLASIVLVDTLKNLDFFFTAEQTEAFLQLYRDDYKNAIENIMPNYLFVEQTPTEVRSRLQGEFLQVTGDFAAKALRTLYYTDVRPSASQVTVPVRAIMSESGPVETEINRKYFRDFDFVTLSGVGHYPMLERPEEFNRLLENLLNSEANSSRPSR